MYNKLKELLVEAMGMEDYIASSPYRAMSGATRAYKRMQKRKKLPSGAHIKGVIPQSKKRKGERFEKDMDRRAKDAEDDESTHLDQWTT